MLKIKFKTLHLHQYNSTIINQWHNHTETHGGEATG